MPQNFTIPKDNDGQRIDRFLRKTFPQIPLSVIYKFFRKKKIKLNGKPAKQEMSLKEGDKITIFFNTDGFAEAAPKKAPDYQVLAKSDFARKNFQVLFEDEWLIAANKPANLPVHPGSGVGFSKNLIDLATAYALTKDPNAPPPQLAHRLDKDTSGIILIAKNGSTLRKLTAEMRSDGFEKFYQTLVRGHLEAKKGTIREKILRDEKGVRVSGKREAKEAITHYEVIREFAGASLLNIRIETGRTHQIRVHFADKGHPVALDDKYGDFAWNKALKRDFGLDRQFLHASRLIFTHPETGKRTEILCPLPKDLADFLAKI